MAVLDILLFVITFVNLRGIRLIHLTTGHCGSATVYGEKIIKAVTLVMLESSVPAEVVMLHYGYNFRCIMAVVMANILRRKYYRGCESIQRN